MQDQQGGITKLTPGICGRAIALEWQLMPKPKLEPGMSAAEIAARLHAGKDRRDQARAQHHNNMDGAAAAPVSF